MADQVIVIKERRRGGSCGCLVALALCAFVGVLVRGWYKAETQELDKRAAFERARNAPQNNIAHASQSTHVAPAPDASALPGWRIVSKRDEMTDEAAYYFALDGVRVDAGPVEYVPRLVIKAVPVSSDPLKYSAEMCVMIETEGMQRNTQEVAYRFGTRPAVQATLQTSADRHAVFLPSDALASLDGSPTFVLRFTTTLGATRTLRFTTEGFTVAAFERELARQIKRAK